MHGKDGSMKHDIDQRWFIGALSLVLVIVAVIAWKQFGGSKPQMTAVEAGLGKPLHPGEIPGRQGAVQAPITR